MTTYEESIATTTAPEPDPATMRDPMFGRATPIVATIAIVIVSIVTWWILADAKWSISEPSPAVVQSLLFWTILGFIFTGFTFGNWPFTKLAQPLAGIAQVITNLVIGVLGTLLFTRGVGHWDPTFSPDAPGGAGYTAAAFIVLIGFFAYTLASASWGGYPFESVPAPLASAAQFFLAAFLTLIGVVTLVYPNFNAQLAAHAPVSLPTALGWVYCSIVICIVSAMQWQNWPWAGIPNRHLRALAALVIALGGGFLLMLVLKEVVYGIVPSDIKLLPTFSAASETAELGVCFSLWSLTVGLVFGPSRIRSVPAARAVRTLVVAALAVATYVVSNRFFATKVLHFPALKGSYGGDPLAFIDWTILIVLWHAVAFGGHLTTRRARPAR
jgi:AAT family amino acid transporter